MTIVSIEGNIGSGKSTLLEYLKQDSRINNRKNIIFLDEPVKEWAKIIDKNNVTMLEKFYSDQKKYSFSFQMMAYISRLSLLKAAQDENPNAIIITERSLYTDKYVFAQMLYDNEHIEETDMKIYLQWFDHFIKEFTINKIVYVNTDPNICDKRVLSRNRPGETIPLTYLINCDKYHGSMMENFTEDQIFRINGDIDHTDDNSIVEKWINDIINDVIEPLINEISDENDEDKLIKYLSTMMLNEEFVPWTHIIKNNYHRCLEFVLKHPNVIFSDIEVDLYLLTLQYDNYKCFVTLHENNWYWKYETLSDACKCDNYDCFTYAYENGCPIHSYVVDAAKEFSPKCYEYLQRMAPDLCK
jgi:deoxyadenosine/deoxycytidine kinase